MYGRADKEVYREVESQGGERKAGWLIDIPEERASLNVHFIRVAPRCLIIHSS